MSVESRFPLRDFLNPPGKRIISGSIQPSAVRQPSELSESLESPEFLPLDPLSPEEEFSTLLEGQKREALEAIFAVRMAATQNLEATVEAAKQFLPEETVELLLQTIMSAQREPFLQGFADWLGQLDVFALSQLSLEEEDAWFAEQEKVGNNDLFFALDAYPRIRKIIADLRNHRPLTAEQRQLSLMLSFLPAMVHYSSDGSNFLWEVTSETAPYVLANLFEYTLVRPLVPQEVYLRHQEHFTKFIQQADEKGEGYPEYLTPLQGYEAIWCLLNPRNIMAHADHSYFLDHPMMNDVETLSHVMTHERIHNIVATARRIGFGPNRHASPDLTRYEEAYVEGLACMLQAEGDLKIASLTAVIHPCRYTSQVLQLFNAIEDLQALGLYSEPIVLFWQALWEVEQGKTLNVMQAIEDAINEHLSPLPAEETTPNQSPEDTVQSNPTNPNQASVTPFTQKVTALDLTKNPKLPEYDFHVSAKRYPELDRVLFEAHLDFVDRWNNLPPETQAWFHNDKFFFDQGCLDDLARVRKYPADLFALSPNIYVRHLLMWIRNEDQAHQELLTAVGDLERIKTQDSWWQCMNRWGMLPE